MRTCMCTFGLYGQTPDESDLYPRHAGIHPDASASLCPADSLIWLTDRVLLLLVPTREI